MSLRKGIVVEVHPEDHSVDLVMADDGSRLTGVQVQTSNGSTRTGTVDLPEIPKRKDKWDVSTPTGQDMHALVDFVGRTPVVTGFLYPQVNQMLSKDGKLRLTRHQSDVITATDGDGNFEYQHPGGFYARIGETPDSVSLKNKNADANLTADRNTGRKVNVRIELPGVFRFTMTPDGDAELILSKDFILKAAGNANIQVQGDALVQAAGAATVQAPTITLDGDTTVTKTLTVQGDTTLHNVTSNGKNISDTHVHKDTMAGPGTSGTVA
jgi:phage baseplate assembly protein gpV